MLLTSLQLYGTPGRPFRPVARQWLLPLEFRLRLGGERPRDLEAPADRLFCKQGDAGVQLTVEVLDQDGLPVNLAPAASTVIKLLYPDGLTTADLAASLLSGGADGRMYFTTAGGTLPQVGLYRIQGKVAIAGAARSTEWGAFWAGRNVDPT